MIRRNTNQRQIVYETLNELGHATSEYLIEYIQKNHDNISLATIYRNLNILIDEGKVKKIKLAQKDVYETVKTNHYHFVCECCKNVYDVDSNLVDGFVKIKELEGNIVKNCEVNLYGICKKCQIKN